MSDHGSTSPKTNTVTGCKAVFLMPLISRCWLQKLSQLWLASLRTLIILVSSGRPCCSLAVPSNSVIVMTAGFSICSATSCCQSLLSPHDGGISVTIYPLNVAPPFQLIRYMSSLSAFIYISLNCYSVGGLPWWFGKNQRSCVFIHCYIFLFVCFGLNWKKWGQSCKDKTEC